MTRPRDATEQYIAEANGSENQEAEPQQAQDTEETQRGMDPELKVMSALIRTIEKIEEPARRRVVRWLVDRYAEPAF